jgi:putative addiction module killer protein
MAQKNDPAHTGSRGGKGRVAGCGLLMTGYNDVMNTIHETLEFSEWLERLADESAQLRIIKRIRSAIEGNFGDCKALGNGVSEMRVDYGPGYRVYYARQGLRIYILLAGGDKRTQPRDVKRAKEIWRMMKGGKA